MKEINKFLFYNQLTEIEKKSLTVETYVKDSFVVTFGKNTVEFCYFIIDGKVKVVKNVNGKIIYYPLKLKKNDLLGISLFMADININFDFICNSDELKVIKIPIKIIERLKNESLKFNSYIQKMVIKFLRVYWNVNHIKSIYGNEGFIAYMLLLESNNNYIYIKNFQNFINYLNISSVSFYKILNKFIEANIIIKEQNSIRIINKKKLTSLYCNGLKNNLNH